MQCYKTSLIKINSVSGDDDLVPSGTKPLPERMPYGIANVVACKTCLLFDIYFLLQIQFR